MEVEAVVHGDTLRKPLAVVVQLAKIQAAEVSSRVSYSHREPLKGGRS